MGKERTRTHEPQPPAPAPSAVRRPASVAPAAASPAAPARLHPSRLRREGGSPLPAGLRSGMERALQADLSAVRVHTGAEAATAAQAHHAQAFASGPDVYFDANQYQPGTAAGRHLLAHELAHTVQQGHAAPAPLSSDLPTSQPGDAVEREAGEAADRVGQGGVVPAGALSAAPSMIARQTAPPAPAAPPAAPPAASTAAPTAPTPPGGAPVAADPAAPGDEISLAAAEFVATPAVEAYLEEKRGQEGDVHVALGSLARGVIKVRKQQQGYDTRTKQSVPLTVAALQPVVNAGVQPVLAVEINRGAISGYVTIATRRGAAGNPADLLDWIKTHTTEFGWVGIDVTRFPGVTNTLADGTLTLQVEGFAFKLGGWVDGTANFGLANDVMTFSGTAAITVPGLQQGAQLEIERNAEGHLYARTEIPVTIANFSGNLIAEYANGTFNIEGTAGYQAEKFNGQVTLLVTDAATARSVALRRLGPEAIAASGEQAAGGAAGEPAARGPRPGPRALAGWGVLNFAITEWMTGTAQVIIDNEGHITVVGEIRPPAEVELFAQRDYIKEIFTVEVRTLYGVPLVGNVFLFANIGLEALAKLGPGKIYNIVLQGTYSTDPAVLQNFSLAASLNISAFAGLRLRAEGGLGVELLGHDIKAGVGLNALAGVRGYVEATPTIGYRETADPEQGKKGEYYLNGHMELAAQPFLGFSGDLFVELDSPWWSPAPDKKWTWPLGSLEYPLPGEFGIGADVNYVIGSPELPEIQFGEVAFDSSKFMTDLMNDHVPQGSTGEQEKQGEWQEGAPTGEGAVDPTVAAQGGAPAAAPATGQQQPGDGEPPSPEVMQRWGAGMEALRALAEQSQANPLSEQEITAALAPIKTRYGFQELRPSREGNDWSIHAVMNPTINVPAKGEPPAAAQEGAAGRPTWISTHATPPQVTRIQALYARASTEHYRARFRDMFRTGDEAQIEANLALAEQVLNDMLEEQQEQLAAENAPVSSHAAASQAPGAVPPSTVAVEPGTGVETTERQPFSTQEHHILPNAARFRPYWSKLQINHNRYAVTIDTTRHQTEAHAEPAAPAVGGGAYNNDWWSFLTGIGLDAITRQQVYQFAQQMVSRYNFDGLPIHVYGNASQRTSLDELR